MAESEFDRANRLSGGYLAKAGGYTEESFAALDALDEVFSKSPDHVEAPELQPSEGRFDFVMRKAHEIVLSTGLYLRGIEPRDIARGGLAGGVSLISMASLAACAETPVTQETGDPTGDPTDIATPTPIETEAPGVESPFTGELAITPQQVAEIKGLSLQEIQQLNPDERTGYFLSFASDPKTGLKAYADFYNYVTDLSNDVLPESISVDNTPEEIIEIAAFNQRFVASFDLPEAQKLATGLYNDLNNGNYSGFDDWIQANAPIDSRGLGALSDNGGGIRIGTVVSASEKMQADQNSQTYIVIVVKRSDGKEVSIPYTFVTNGTMGTWVQGAATEVG